MDKILLEKAIERALGKLVFFKESGMFSYIYPFTTENIAGYIDMFDLNNKKLVVTGSSCDQIINARMKGCKDITIVDVCPYTKPYFFLKKAALMSLDYESFRFWNSMFDRVDPYKVRLNIFSQDEDRYEVVKELNLYLRNEASYNEAKKLIEDVEPKFIQGNIFDIELDEEYDNIWLSNLAQYYPLEEHKKLLDKLSGNLRKNGKMLVSYLYGISDEYIDLNGEGIYDIDKAQAVLGDYITKIEAFVGTKGLKFKSDYLKDSVMIYQKTPGKK